MPRLSPTLSYSYYDSPVGSLLVAGTRDSLHLLSFPTGSRVVQVAASWQRDDSLFTSIFEQLDAYFAGQRQQFDLALNKGGTPFQNDVWAALRQIPYGETITYGELATRVGRPKASRAVGAANGANPLSIVVPCHRVIGSNGALTGFGGGIETKKYLIAHERADTKASPT